MNGAAAPSPGAARSADAGGALSELGAVAGYIRVSTTSQDHAYQRRAIELAASVHGEPVSAWYADVASGKTLKRRELEKMCSALRSGAIRTVWVWRIDRLTRSGIADTLELVRLIRESGAVLRSVADGYAVDGSPAGDLVLAVLAWAAQLEREKIAENQAAARARLAAEGRGWGRPRLAPYLGELARELRARGHTTRAIAAELGIGEGSVRNFLRASGAAGARENEAAQ